MTPDDRKALERLCARVDHTAATAKLLGELGCNNPEMTDAIRGVGETLSELAERMDGILNPRGAA